MFLNDFAPDFDWSGLGNFGGKIDPNDSFSKNAPIINFTGLGSGLGGELDNNSSTVIHFNKMGYKNQDHYVLRWTRPVTLDPRSILEGARKEYVLKARKFIEALLAYTGAECVNIIAFSYGNIVAGAAIKGGTYPNIAGENYYVGPPITDKICNYLGIGSPHSGAGTAQLLGEVSDATNDHIGVEPGSEFLINLEANPALLARQGGKIGSIRSSNNDLFIGPGWSRPFRGNTHDWDMDLPHFKLIHQTTDLQYRFFHGMN